MFGWRQNRCLLFVHFEHLKHVCALRCGFVVFGQAFNSFCAVKDVWVLVKANRVFSTSVFFLRLCVVLWPMIAVYHLNTCVWLLWFLIIVLALHTCCSTSLLHLHCVCLLFVVRFLSNWLCFWYMLLYTQKQTQSQSFSLSLYIVMYLCCCYLFSFVLVVCFVLICWCLIHVLFLCIVMFYLVASLPYPFIYMMSDSGLSLNMFFVFLCVWKHNNLES